jgi:hypothetical protein
MQAGGPRYALCKFLGHVLIVTSTPQSSRQRGQFLTLYVLIECLAAAPKLIMPKIRKEASTFRGALKTVARTFTSQYLCAPGEADALMDPDAISELVKKLAEDGMWLRNVSPTGERV